MKKEERKSVEMKDFSQEIVSRIKGEHIQPDSKWRLNWKSYVFWALMIFMVLLGALFFSLMILNLTDMDRELFHYLEFRKVVFILFRTIPYLWIFLLACTLFFGITSFRKTKKGYRHSTLFIASLAVLTVSFLGAGVHFFKVNERFERNIFPGKPSSLGELAHPRENRWMRPGDGLLGGEIIEAGENFLVLRNLQGEIWRAEYSQETKIRPGTKLEIGSHAGVIGEKTGEFLMQAKAIRNLPPPRDDPHRNDGGEQSFRHPIPSDFSREKE